MGSTTVRELRIRLKKIRPDSDFDAFCLDYFPVVYRRFSGAMNRTARMNLLLQCEKTTDIVIALDSYDAEASQSLAERLENPTIEPMADMQRGSNEIPCHQILFEYYRSDCEKFYVNRPIDDHLTKLGPRRNLWIYGDSGSGKTAAVTRYLEKSHLVPIYINLGACSDSSPTEALRYMIYYISDHFGCQHPSLSRKLSPPMLVDALIGILNSKGNISSRAIFIEEFTMNSNCLQKFVRIMYNILSRNSGRSVFYVVTLLDPMKIWQQFTKKRLTNTEFLFFDKWQYDDLRKLTSLIIENIEKLGFSERISEQEILRLLKSAEGCPRFVKRVFQNLLAPYHGSFPSWDEAMNKALSER